MATYNVVTQYGADPTGVSDSTAEFQSALNDIGTAGSGTLLVPSGTYLISAYLQIKPPGSIIISMYGATLKRKNGSGALSIFKNYTGSTNYPGFTGPKNITIQGGILDLNAATNLEGSQGISIAHSENLLIEDVTVQNVPGGHAIEVNSTQTAIVRNCTFRGFVITTNNYNEAVQIDGAFTSAMIGSAPWDMTTCDDITVTGCTMEPYNGLYCWGSLTGSHSGREGYPHTNIHVTDNIITDSIHYGVKVMNWRGADITGNTFTGCNGGVSVVVRDDCLPIDGTTTTLTQNIDISGNTFTTMGNNPFSHVGPLGEVIKVYGLVSPYSHVADVTIDSNVITGYANTVGIAVLNSDRVYITNNQLTEPVYTTQTPVAVWDSDTVEITGNTLEAGNPYYIITDNVTNLTDTPNTTSTVSTEDEIMANITFAEDLTDRSTTSTTYVDVSALSCNIVVPASRKVYITIQSRQSGSASWGVLTSFRISEGAHTVLLEGDDRGAQTFVSSSGECTVGTSYLADFSTLDSGSVAAGDTITVTLKHRVGSGSTGWFRYRNITLQAVNA